MQSFFAKPMGAWLTGYLPVVVCAAVMGCGGEIPSSPSAEPSGQVASARSAFASVVPRQVRLECSVGTPCDIQIVVTLSSPIVMSFGLQGGRGFGFNESTTTCFGNVAGSCVFHLTFAAVAEGRYSATLRLEDITNGAVKTMRVSARVS
jgi:hypothetical protein